MLMHIERGTYDVKQARTKVGEVWVSDDGTALTQHWFLFSKVPSGALATYVMPSSRDAADRSTDIETAFERTGDAPATLTTRDVDDALAAFDAKGITAVYIRATPVIGATRVAMSADDIDKLGSIGSMGGASIDGQIDWGFYYIWQGSSVVGHVSVSPSSGGETRETWDLYAHVPSSSVEVAPGSRIAVAAYTAPGSSGGAYRLQSSRFVGPDVSVSGFTVSTVAVDCSSLFASLTRVAAS